MTTEAMIADMRKAAKEQASWMNFMDWSHKKYVNMGHLAYKVWEEERGNRHGRDSYA